MFAKVDHNAAINEHNGLPLQFWNRHLVAPLRYDTSWETYGVVCTDIIC